MLFGSSVLEIAIGLTFVYVLLALVCSTLNEWIAGIFKLRAKTLRKGIATLLEDPEVEGLAKLLFDHPLFQGWKRKGEKDFPSYIPARTFTLALIDIILPAETSSGSQNLLEVYEKIRTKLTEFSAANSGLAKSLLILMNQAGVDPKKIDEAAYALRQLELVRTNLLEFVGQVDPSDVGTLGPLAETLDRFRQLESAMRQAEVDARASLFQAQQNVERYYDDAMDRVSGWYKRRAQVIIVVLAIVVTGLLNADTIAIVSRFRDDPVLLQQVVAAAEEFSQASRGAATATSTAPVATQAAGTVSPGAVAASETLTVTSTSAMTATPETTAITTTVLATPEEIVERLNALSALGLPLGWREIPKTPDSVLLKIVGLFITIVAVSLGAPFWFDLLNKLVSLRMAGAKPASTTAAPETGIASVLETRLLPVSGVRASPATVARAQRGGLADLAARALKYVEELKNSRTLSVSERDIAVAWLLMEATNQELSVTPEEIAQAIDQARSSRT
jgi:hypothetical protein